MLVSSTSWFSWEKESKGLLAHKLLTNSHSEQYFVGHTSHFLSSSHHNCLITQYLKNCSKYSLTLSWDFPWPNWTGLGLSRSIFPSSEVLAVGCQEMAHLWLLQKVPSVQTARGFGQPVSPATIIIICSFPKWTCSVVGQVLLESNIAKKENNPCVSISKQNADSIAHSRIASLLACAVNYGDTYSTIVLRSRLRSIPIWVLQKGLEQKVTTISFKCSHCCVFFSRINSCEKFWTYKSQTFWMFNSSLVKDVRKN